MGDSPDNRIAHSLFNVKSIDEGQRIIEGIASTPELDRQGDVMDSHGAKFKLPIPFLWQHQKERPIGHVLSATPTPEGIKVRVQIEKSVLPFIEEAWQLIKSRLVRGLSIGWRPLAQPSAVKGGVKYSSWEWLELSAVTIPANASATITLIKSLDAQAVAALGPSERKPTPGATGLRKSTVMNISEQIASVNEQIRNKSLRLEELMASNDAEGGLETVEAAELEGLTPEIKSLTKKLDQLSTLESAQLSTSKTITSTAGQLRSTPRVTVTDHVAELPKGTLFTRYAMAKAAGKGSFSDTIAYARRWDAQTPEVTAYLKAEAGTAVVQSPGWGGELAYQNNLAAEFVEIVRPLTIIGRVNGFRNVPFNVRIPVQSGGSTVNWVGEGAPKPVTELAFTTTTVPNHKMAGIIVLTDELVRLSNPKAEELVRRDLTEQIAQFRDEQFIRVDVTAGANNPASITNGVTAPNASGTTMAHLMADLNTAIQSIITAGHSAAGLVIVTTSEVALRLSLMIHPASGMKPAGFDVSPNGGTLLGYPVIVSDSVDADTLVIFKPSEIFLADDGRVSLDASNQATLDMDGGETADFNLWQRNCTAIRAEQWITWVKRRTGAVAVIDTIAYVPGT